MINIPYLHFSKDKKNLIKSYYIALIPLIIFSFYKNGLILYQNNFISFLDIFIPMYFYLISITIGFIISLINKEDKWEYMLYALIISCSISINTNKIIYPILLFIALFITSNLNKKRSFNFVSAARIIVILSLLLGSYSYLNVSEKLNAFNYDLFDLFWGYSAGGIASNSLFFLLISVIILFTNRFFKKIIPLFASLSFIVILLIVYFISKDIDYLYILLNGSVYYGFIFVGADLYNTPCTKNGKLIYGLLIGIISALFGIWLPMYEISYLSILIVSLFIPLIDKISVKKLIK